MGTGILEKNRKKGSQIAKKVADEGGHLAAEASRYHRQCRSPQHLLSEGVGKSFFLVLLNYFIFSILCKYTYAYK